jgi:hypothetical protein
VLFTPIATAKESPVEEITRLPSGFASKTYAGELKIIARAKQGTGDSSRPRTRAARRYFLQILPRLVRIDHG